MADTIGESPITKDHLEKILRDYFKTNAKLEAVEGKIISKGLGFLSDVMRVTLKWDVQNGLPAKIIVKAPTSKNVKEITQQLGSSDVSEDFIPAVHEAECKAYDILAKENAVPIPKVYACWPITDTNPGLIVMEDLSDRAGIIDNIADGLNLNQWKNVVALLADLHAWSLTTKVPWRDTIPGFESLAEAFRSFDKMTSFGLRQAKKKYPEYFANVDEDVVLKEINADAMIKKHLTFSSVMEEVLQHGDTWVNNIMFNKRQDGSLDDTVAALIDWQICVKGSCVSDMTRLESWCVNHELRRAHYKELLRFYYDRLKEKAGKKVTTSYEKLEKIYEQAFALDGFLSVAMIEPMLTAIAKVDEDKTGWRKKEMLERAKAAYEDAKRFLKLP